MPDLCTDLRFDSIVSMRGEIFIFKGTFVWRFTEEFELIPGYPTHFRHIFQGIPSHVDKIDAAYQRYTDGAIILFSGKSNIAFNPIAIKRHNLNIRSKYRTEILGV